MQLTNKIIFSIERTERPAQQHEIEAVAKRLDAKIVLGSYNNELEVSFIVDADKRQDAQTMAALFNQESILILNDESADLYYLETGKIETIGSKMVKVDKKPLDGNYTLIGSDFYVVQ